MWGESSKNCEINCQCSGLITENFKINSGNSGTKRKQEDSLSHNFKLRMNPHTIDFTKSPLSPIVNKRRILGEIQLPKSPLERLKSPITQKSPFKSPLLDRLDRSSPLSTRCKRSKISRVFEDRTRFKMENKENDAPLISKTFVQFDDEEETRDFSFGARFQSARDRIPSWSASKLDFSDALQKEPEAELYVPEKDATDDDCMLHDLEAEFEADNFDECTKYEIISTDSPDIISRGRASTRKVTARNFIFGAPLADTEQSTSFNKPSNLTTRMLNFEESFEFTSPAIKKSHAAKKSLKFSEGHTLRHERSDSSIGSMSSSSPKLTLYTSESTASMESGFISELEPFLENEESNSPKLENLSELLSGQIKNSIIPEKNLRRPFNRSLSVNPECKARVSLLSILENPEKRSSKRVESEEVDTENLSKRRKNSEDESELRVPERRPVLHRAFSENNASIMSALARSSVETDLIGDFSRPFALPLTSGNHSDLKSISCDTLAALLRGEYDDVVSDYKVIDCRYPYEFEGGHIQDAVNYYTPTQITTLVSDPVERTHPEKRSILVFHCEFSLERGPKLSRLLRASDRQQHREQYPRLSHPEVYLLHEGYRAFYQRHRSLCSPAGYTAMLDPSHRQELKMLRSVNQPATSGTRRRSRLLF